MSTADQPANRPPPNFGPSPLDQFKAQRTKRLTLHRLEVALLSVVTAHLAFLPWAIGTMHAWSQWTSLSLSALSLVLSLLPRDYSPEHTDGPSHRALFYPRLLRFPLFWIGAALLALVAVQALNPSWEYRIVRLWWMQRIDYVRWLPTGVRVPFARWGPWRMLLIYSSAWLTVCAIWTGFTRRRTIQRLFTALVINGVALSAFGLAERAFGNGKIFWVRPSANSSFFASFVYKNHAGAYLDLILAIACGLAAWHHVRGARRLQKSNPSGVFVFLATCIAVSVLVSFARGATIVMLMYLCVVVIGFLYHQWRLPKGSRKPAITIALLLVFGLFLRSGLRTVESRVAWGRLEYAFSGEDLSVTARLRMDQACFEMLKDHWAMGVGSGSFQFLFTIYQQRYPDLLRPGGGPVFWEHAHNDFLEIPIELGLPGVLLIVAGFVSYGVLLVRNYVWQNALSISIVLGCLSVFGMAWGDFVFENPAVLTTWCAMWPAAAIWTKLEEQRYRT